MTAGAAHALVLALAVARSCEGMDGFVLCSDWPERDFGGKMRRGGPAHCTCGPGQMKEHQGDEDDYGWHCTDIPAKYCEFDAICSHCKALGWWPVCGVDGQTYSSACRAKCKCVAVASEGACEGWGSGIAQNPSSSSPAAVDTERAESLRVSARVQITRADGTELAYHSRPPSENPTVANYLEAAPDATTNLEHMELLHEHVAKSSVQSPSAPPPASDEAEAIPAHLSDWQDAEDLRPKAGAADEDCEGEDGMCFEKNTDAGKDGSGGSPQGVPARSDAAKSRRASYGTNPQASAYSTGARDYASNGDRHQKNLKQEL